MEFLPSLSLWQWILAGMVPPALFALYFLKLRRDPLAIPSTLLWRQSLEDLRVNSLWQRLRHSTLLLLQLLVVALLLFCLANPTIQSSQTRRNFVFLIDNSASMSATDATAGTRLEQAKQKAIDLVDSLQPGDAVMVLTFSDRAEVAGSFSDRHDDVRRTISSIGPSSRRTRPQDAFAIAASAVKSAAQVKQVTDDRVNSIDQPSAEGNTISTAVHLFTDGAFDQRSLQELSALDLTFHQMGTSAGNIAVTAMSTRRRDDTPEVVELFARLSSSEPAEAAAELLVDGTLQDLQRVKWTEAGEQTAFFSLNIPREAVLKLNLRPTSGANLLTLDDAAWALVGERRRARVLLFSDQNDLLQRVLSTPAMARLADVETLPAAAAEGKELAGVSRYASYDLVIFDRCRPKTLPESNTFTIGSLPTSLAPTLPQVKENPIILTWNRAHPALQFADLSDVYVTSFLPVEAPSGSQTLISSDQGPLLLETRRGPYTDLIQTFSLIDGRGTWQTDWPLRLSFPLYLFNVVRYLGGEASSSETLRRAGEPIEFRPASAQKEITVLLPDGKESKYPVGSSRTVQVRQTEQLGVYVIDPHESDQQLFAINLLDESESAIQPTETLQTPGLSVEATRERSLQRRELWEPLTLVLIGLLLLEWFIFNRRVIL